MAIFFLSLQWTASTSRQTGFLADFSHTTQILPGRRFQKNHCQHLRAQESTPIPIGNGSRRGDWVVESTGMKVRPRMWVWVCKRQGERLKASPQCEASLRKQGGPGCQKGGRQAYSTTKCVPTSCSQKTLPPERQGWKSDLELCAHLGFNSPFKTLVSKHTQVTKLCHSSQTNPESIITSIALCSVRQNKEKRLRNWPPVLSELRTAGRRRASSRPAQEVKRWGRMRRRGRLKRKGSGEKVQSLTCLLYRHEELRLNQRIHL